MRIISGKFRGRNLLKSDQLKDLRPTTDANREALFNILNSAKFLKEINFKLENSTIIDICCGTGAVAFEALSRGAKSAILIDNNKIHLDLAKKNAQMLEIAELCQFLFLDVKKDFNLTINTASNLIFIDPPYEEDFKIILNNLTSQKTFPQNSLFVVETVDFKGDLEIDNLRLLDKRKYGKTVFLFFTNI
jgi:16S rRNA (guanine966-N2)-methyltransferase